jgi:hypothetical protein
VNLEEAKKTLMINRNGTADADEPEIADALLLAESNPELARWLEAQTTLQLALRAKFGEIKPPAGLKEQILSEHAAGKRVATAPRLGWYALAAVLLVMGALALVWYPKPASDEALSIYQNAMVRTALDGTYAMDLLTNSSAPVRAYLAENNAPADFTLPSGLQHAALTGCAVRNWQGTKVSLVCFRTGKRLPPGEASDLWLFVVDRSAVKNAPAGNAAQLAKINRLNTATWTDGNKLYFLGVAGQEADVKQYL